MLLLRWIGAVIAIVCVGALAPALAQTTYKYDARGRLIEVNENNDKTITYTYDDAGNRIAESTADAAALLSIASASGAEGNPITFVVTRSGNLSTATSVDYATSTGTAGATDFSAASGPINFAVSETSKNIVISTTHDVVYEPNETFTVTLSNPASNAEIVGGVATGTINNNDSAPYFTINSPSVSEGGQLQFIVTKNGASAFTHNVNYASSNGTATAGSDYTAVSNTLSFTSSQYSKTVNISTTEDASYEANETLSVTLSGPTNGATVSGGPGTGTINNDDAPVVYVRNPSGVLQPGFTESSTWSAPLQKFIDRTKEGSTVIYQYNNEFGEMWCVTSVTLASGYSWTGNGCELRVD